MKKKILSFMFVICICLNLLAVSPLSVFAEESGTCGDNLTWTLSGNTLTISGTGDMYDYNSDIEVPWYQIKDDIYYLVIDSGVTSIGNYAFYRVTHITDVTIPTGVKSIGAWSFYSCFCIETITIPGSVQSIKENAFCWCDGLKEVTLTEGIKSIEDYAFIYCKNLSKINIPSSVECIGADVFGDTHNLIITVDENNEVYSSLDGVLFNKDKTEIIKYAKDNIQDEYIIPDGVIFIRSNSFCACKNLKSVQLPNSIEYIEDGAFSQCDTLSNINIPNSVTMIGGSAFYSCYTLTDITIPFGVTYIGGEAFNGCKSLNIYVDEKNEYFSSLDGVLFNKDKTEIITYAKDKINSEYVIPYGVTSIEQYAFYYCTDLTNVKIPNTVKSIERSAFFVCNNLTSIIIPNSINLIEDSAFYYCQSLTDVYYTGTQEQWEQISIGKNNTYLQNATIHYNCSPEQSRPVCQINGAVASADKMTVYVSSSLGAVNNTMLIAKYKSGILIGLTEKQIDLSADSNEVVFENFTKGNADMIKIMLWSRAEPFKPLCGEYTIL